LSPTVAQAVCLAGSSNSARIRRGRALPFREQTPGDRRERPTPELGGACVQARKEERNGNGGGDQSSVRLMHGMRQSPWRPRRCRASGEGSGESSTRDELDHLHRMSSIACGRA
jgi:hypothetical protein